MSKYLIFSPAALLLLLAGCSLAPDYTRPVVNLPDQQVGITASSQEETTRLSAWWKHFGDERLNAMVEQSLSANANLAIAAERIIESRAILGQMKADYFPTLGVSAGASRTDTADTRLMAGEENPSNNFSVSGLLNYEVDLFGKIRNGNAAAREQLLASTYGYYSIRNALIAQLVTLYYQEMAVAEQINLATETIQTRREALEVQQRRYDSGFITLLALQQSKAELADAQVRLPELREVHHQITSSLLILTGADPAAFWQRDEQISSNREIPPPPEVNTRLLPASLLERRPDIMAAEAQLKAANHGVGVARAQRWPTLSLSALLGTVGGDLDELFTDPAATWNLGGNAAGPVYDFGRTRNRVRASEAQQRQAAWNYREVVLEAFAEVNDALAAVQYRNDLVEARQVQRNAFNRTLELARNQYEEGYSDYLELLDAERRSFEANLALVEARYSEIMAYIELCKALGGGWDQQLSEIDSPEYR